MVFVCVFASGKVQKKVDSSAVVEMVDPVIKMTRLNSVRMKMGRYEKCKR